MIIYQNKVCFPGKTRSISGEVLLFFVLKMQNLIK